MTSTTQIHIHKDSAIAARTEHYTPDDFRSEFWAVHIQIENHNVTIFVRDENNKRTELATALRDMSDKLMAPEIDEIERKLGDANWVEHSNAVNGITAP